MAELNWGLLNTNPIAAQSAGFDYAEKVRNAASMRQAGQQYATGDYSGASTTLAKSGDIGNAQKLREAGQQTAAKGQQYIAQALPVLAKIAVTHANDPDGGTQARSQAFDQIAGEAQQVTGSTPQQMAQFKQLWVTDPQGFLARIQASLPVEYKTAGNTLFQFRNGNLAGQYEGTKDTVVPMGGSLYQTGGTGNQVAPVGGAAQSPAGAAPAAPADPAGSPQIIPTADPNAMHSVESGGNPNAVNPVSGATGLSQTMPATLQSPGFGVSPATNNTPAEQQRVGDQYLQAMAQKYNGNAVFAHIAYDMGPGATDRWIAKGAKFSDLPKETQDYLGRIAVAQGNQRGQASQAQAAPQQQGSPPQQGGARLVASNTVPINDEAIRNDVRIWLASKGTINPQYGMGQLGAAQRQAFDTQKNALMKELNVSPEDVASGQAVRKADTQSLVALQKQADQVQAFEGTAKKNGDLALSLLDKGGPQGQSPIINKWTQEWRKWVSGDTHVSQFTTSLGTFADEYAKVVAGQNGSTDAVRAAAYSRINEAMNKQTIRDVIGVMYKEMENRTASNNDQLSTIKQRLGTPGAQASPTPSPQADNIPTVQSPAEAMKLAPGTKFRTPDGRVKIR